MSILGKFMDNIKFNPDDEDDADYFLDDEYDEEYESAEADSKRGSLFSRKASKEDDGARSGGFLNRKVVPMRQPGGMEVTMIKPSSIEDARDICDYLLAGKAVVLNMEGMNMDVAQRIIDFTSGATYSMDGNLQMISKYIFIATPGNVELSGDFQDILSGAKTAQTAVTGLNFNI